MLFFLLYVAVRRMLRVRAGTSTQRSLEIENAVLRHQLSVLRREAKRPRLHRIDKVFLAAASRGLPRERWSSFLVTPQTLLRWHRELVRLEAVPLALDYCRTRLAQDEDAAWVRRRFQEACKSLGTEVTADDGRLRIIWT